jgi:hypothetical protein
MKNTPSFTVRTLLLGLALAGLGTVAEARQGADDPAPPIAGGIPGDDHGGGGHGTDDHGVSPNLPLDAALKPRVRLKLKDDNQAQFSGAFEFRAAQQSAEIKGSAKLKLPNPLTGLDAASAAEALLTAGFSHDGGVTRYAECELALDRVIGKRIAEYNFALKQTGNPGKPRLRVKKGICDIDLATAGIQPGLPVVLSGDQLTVEFQDAVGPITLGAGILK